MGGFGLEFFGGIEVGWLDHAALAFFHAVVVIPSGVLRCCGIVRRDGILLPCVSFLKIDAPMRWQFFITPPSTWEHLLLYSQGPGEAGRHSPLHREVRLAPVTHRNG